MAESAAAADLRDAEWFEGLYRRCAPGVLAYARRRLLQPEDAEDVLVETFTVAWRRRQDMPATEGEALPWLYAVAANTIAHTRRSYARRQRLQEKVAAELPSQSLDPHSAVVDHWDDQAVLAAAWPSLSDADREVLRLWAWEGLDGPSLATALGCSPDAARARLSRAKTRLRTALTTTLNSESTLAAPNAGHQVSAAPDDSSKDIRS